MRFCLNISTDVFSTHFCYEKRPASARGGAPGFPVPVALADPAEGGAASRVLCRNGGELPTAS